MQANVEAVKQFCKFFALKDKNSYLKLCDDNIVWAAAISDGGKCTGKKEMFDDYLPKFFARFKEFRAVYEEFLDAGENVVVLGKYHTISKMDEKMKNMS